MNIFDELEKQYDEIDLKYSILQFNASSRGWVRKEVFYQRQRELNDHAYFLFMFSRLEARIRDESAKLIQQKQSSISSWKQRGPWDSFPAQPDADGLNFKKRLSLLTDKSRSDFALVVDYYTERNSIAHGRSFVNAISMPIAINEFKRLYRILKA